MCPAQVSEESVSHRLRALLFETQGGHLGAHHGTVSAVIAEQACAFVVARFVQITIKERVSQIRSPSHMAVHKQESHITDWVDPPQVGVELQTVEGGNALISKYQVGQVQVTMTFPDTTVEHPLLQQRPQRLP